MIETLREIFGSAEGVRLFRAPGRVNLIGEHTDYNLGFVLPVALDLATTIAMAPSTDGALGIYSRERQERRQWKLEDVAGLQPAHDWSDYPIGVAQQLIRAGFPLRPVNLVIHSTVPEGSGLSSSAALEVSSALALLHGRELNRTELALLCQRAEREFVGMPCGIMDQYISVFGRRNFAVEIDCRSLGHRMVPLPEDVALVVVNTMVKHALASSAYKDRVAECAAAVAGLKKWFPAAQSLRDVTPEQLIEAEDSIPEVAARRARHIVTENLRVNRFVEASTEGDLDAMGQLMFESHASLRDDYQVSCAELDFLVEAAAKVDGVYGSRMTGGGFGGCTVTLLDPEALAAFEESVVEAYQARFQMTPAVIPVRPADGAGEVGAADAPE